MIRRQSDTRRGVAAVELAAVFLLFMIPMMIEIWEIGRLVQVQQIISNAAREGARLAAQGNTINSSGAPTQIYVSSGTPNVHDTVYQYLVAAGLTNLQSSDVHVEFAFTTPTSSGAYPTEPYLGEKNQSFTVRVWVYWSTVRWINLGFLDPNTKVEFTVTWNMLVDDPFTVNESLPTF